VTPALQPLQGWFLSATTHAGDLEAGIAQAVVRYGFGAQAALETVITPGPRLSALERLSIYHDSYRARLVECLADDYPALKYALGEERFEMLAREYIAEHPSRSATLNAYGQHLATFCRRAFLENTAFIAELARLEWSLVEAVHAESPKPLTLESLEGLSPDRFALARFVPNAALRVLHFEYPVNDYYRAFREDLAPSVPQASACHVAVYRRDLTLWRRDLTPPAARLLEALAAGETLTAALSQLEAFPDVSAQEVMSWFHGWIADGLFSAIVTQ